MMQIQIQIGTLPISLVLISNGTLVFVKTLEKIGVIFDQPENGVGATFEDDCFYIAGEHYSYNTIYEYKHIPDMLEWLQAQNLQEPAVMF